MSGVEGQRAISHQPVGFQPQGPVRPALSHYLLEQLSVLEASVPLAAAADPEGIHDARVSVRRLRSVAACFSLLLPAIPADDVGVLKELARGLGESRDAQVQAQRLSLALDSLGPWHSENSLRTLVDELRSQAVERAATLEHAGVAPVLGRLRLTLDATRRQTDKSEVVGALQARWERLGILMQKASEPLSPEEHHRRLHSVRKALKGLRYSAEAVTAAFGEPAMAIVRPAMALQRILGEQHDAVVASELLATASGIPGIDPRDAAELARRESEHAVSAEIEYVRRVAHDPVPPPARVLALQDLDSPQL